MSSHSPQKNNSHYNAELHRIYYNGEGQIALASIHTILSLLIDVKSSFDHNLLDILLTTYRRYITPRSLLLRIKTRLKEENFNTNEGKSRTLRIFNIIKVWIKKFPNDFLMDGSFYGYTVGFLKSIKTGHQAKIAQSLLENLKDLKEVEKKGGVEKKSVAFSEDTKGEGKNSVIDWSEKEIATQVTLLETESFKGINPIALLSGFPSNYFSEYEIYIKDDDELEALQSKKKSPKEKNPFTTLSDEVIESIAKYLDGFSVLCFFQFVCKRFQKICSQKNFWANFVPKIHKEGLSKDFSKWKQLFLKINKEIVPFWIHMLRFGRFFVWVQSQVLCKSVSSEAERVKLIEKFIVIAEQCGELNNYRSMIQIYLALRAPPIRRLKEWQKVNPKYLTSLSLMSQYMNPVSYRESVKYIGFCVPYFSVHLRGIEELEERHKDTIEDLVNIEKFRLITEEIKKMNLLKLSHPTLPRNNILIKQMKKELSSAALSKFSNKKLMRLSRNMDS